MASWSSGPADIQREAIDTPKELRERLAVEMKAALEAAWLLVVSGSDT
jgi:hypothetical protein